MKHCIIIGGGVIGLASAYYLAKAGHPVTVLDKDDMQGGCSYGNAGMIVPSHIIPLAQPGVMAQGLRWLLDNQSPFYVQPRLSLDLLRWGLAFWRAATAAHVRRSMPVLRDISLLSKGLYQALAAAEGGFMYQEKGLLMLYRTPHVAEEEIRAAEAAQGMGLDVEVLSQSQLPALETGLLTSAIGGVHYRSDAHLYPDKLMVVLKATLARMQVRIVPGAEVLGFDTAGGLVASVHTTQGKFAAQEVVVATGSWSPALAKQLGVRIDLLPGKGYSFTLKAPSLGPTIPSILCEGKVAVTPMGSDLRFGGTMEITHTGDTHIRTPRVAGIHRSIRSFYPTLDIAMPAPGDIWFGLRPCTPTGLPIICRSRRHRNVVIATGHGMMGLSLAPATGKLVQELVSGHTPSVDIGLLSY